MKLGRVKDVNHCGQLCCQRRNCDLAFSVDDFCYNVECQSEKMCRLKNETFFHHKVAVTLVTRSSLDTVHEKDRNIKNEDKINSSFTKDNSQKLRVPKKIKNKYQNSAVKSYQSNEKETEFELQDSFPTKAVVQLESNLIKDKNVDVSNPNSCRARRILRRVTLRSGLKSGDFSDYGQVPDINACVKHCCRQKTCDVSLLLNNHCYTLHCYKPELCKIVPAHESKLEPQLAFVTRSTNEVDQEKRNKRAKKKTSSSNGGLCLHGAIFSGVSLKGGHKAGKFELLPGAKDMRSCIQNCCASQSCQVAWLLGDHCYSVSCYDKCITVRKPSDGIRSQLTLLTGKSKHPGNESKYFRSVFFFAVIVTAAVNFYSVTQVYLLLIGFVVCYVSYGPSFFFAWTYGPGAKFVGHKSKRRKRVTITYSTDPENEVSMKFIIFLGSNRERRFQVKQPFEFNAIAVN